jgi:hypothetical protein
MTGADYKTFEHFAKIFFDRRQPLEAILRRYEVPSQDASVLLEEAVLELIYKGENAEDPASWLEARVRAKCRKYWIKRRRLLASAVCRLLPVPSPEVPSPDVECRSTQRGAEDAQDPSR